MKIRPLDSPEEEKKGQKRYVFFCPGCKCGHCFRTGPNGWTFNGDMDKPTVNPSILTAAGPGMNVDRCHSYIREGKIQFLNDCHHELRGKTVSLEDF